MYWLQGIDVSQINEIHATFVPLPEAYVWTKRSIDIPRDLSDCSVVNNNYRMSGEQTGGAGQSAESAVGIKATPPAVAGLVPEQVSAKSKWSGVPSFRTSEGLPPPSISFDANGGVYVWGKMADDVEVSSKNTDNIEDGKGSRLSGFRRLAYLCGGLAVNNDLGNHEVPSNAQFTIPLPKSVEADTVSKVDAGDMHIILQARDKTLYSVGIGAAALQEGTGTARGFEKCHINGGQAEEFACGREHTIVAVSSDSELEYKNSGGAQSLESIPLSLCSLDDTPLYPTKLNRKPVICSFGDGNIASMALLNDDSEKEVDCLVMWRNNVEGEFFLREVATAGDGAKNSTNRFFRSEDDRHARDGIGNNLGIRGRTDDSFHLLPPLRWRARGGDDERSGKLQRIAQVVCGERSFLILDSDGDVHWNSPDRKTGSTRKRGMDSVSVAFPESEGSRCIKIAAGERHYAALFEGGRLYMWGSNQHGQVAPRSSGSLQKTKFFINEPVEVQLCDEEGVQLIVKDVACGSMHTTALASGGTVFVWGRTPSEQFGNGIDLQETGVRGPAEESLLPFADLAGQFVCSIGCGPLYSIAVVQPPRLKLEGRVVGHGPRELWRKSVRCKRAKNFGIRSNFSSRSVDITCLSHSYTNFDKEECQGKAVVVCRPADGFPESTTFADIAEAVHAAGAAMMIFCCYGPKAMRAKALEPVKASVKSINIPVISVSENGGAMLGCQNCRSDDSHEALLSTELRGNLKIRLKWYGDAPSG
jgi:hypothetical protein